MCWNSQVSLAMVGLGAAATAVMIVRRDAPPIWLTLGYFTAMEALQVWGYRVIDNCGTLSNQTVTVLSYLHIVFQPFFINAIAMELVPGTVKRRAQAWVYLACAVSAAAMLLQIAPVQAFGSCLPGSPLCADRWCTVSGEWHIAWDVPYNGFFVGMERTLGVSSGFPSYMLAAFVLPLAYGAWRFVALHALAGPLLAWSLTDDPNEMPAIWCLFSIVILLIGLSPLLRRSVTSTRWWGRTVAGSS